MDSQKPKDELLYVLGLLSKEREELVSTFLEKDPELIGLTFKYETNQAAFDLVRERFATLWLDKHIQKLLEDDVSPSTRRKAMELISDLMKSSGSELDYSQIKHSLLKTKSDVIRELLKHEDSNSQKLNELRFSYEKDKALFERKFREFDSQMAGQA